MEPVSAPTEQTPRKGRKGSLENPEIIENVPGHIIPIIEREFDDFDNEAEQFLSGQTDETEFIKFRLKQGVYGQRQPDVQMIRVKLPFGAAYVRYFVRHPTTQAMPRKFKTSFTSSDADRAISGIHDGAFLPVIRDGKRGF